MHSHDLEDLVQAGNIGLMQAARRFDPSRGIKFSTFASSGIIGRAIDQLRATYGMRGGRYGQKIRPLLATDLAPLDDEEQPMERIAGDAGPEIDARIARVRRAVRDRLRKLFPVRTVSMALMCVFDRRTQRDVGEAFGLTESRMNQILSPIREQVVAIIESEIGREALA